MREIEGKSFRWIVGGIGWPGVEVEGYVCAVGSCYLAGIARPHYYLLKESVDRDIKDVCSAVFEFDISYGPEIWLTDIENDAAVAMFAEKSRKIREVLAGVSYEMGRSPLHRRIISLSRSPLLEMSNGPEYARSLLKGLLSGDNCRLFLPKKSKIIEQLRVIERADKPLWESWPGLAALGFCAFELERIAENERVQLTVVKRPPPDRLRYHRQNRR